MRGCGLHQQKYFSDEGLKPSQVTALTDRQFGDLTQLTVTQIAAKKFVREHLPKLSSTRTAATALRQRLSGGTGSKDQDNTAFPHLVPGSRSNSLRTASTLR